MLVPSTNFFFYYVWGVKVSPLSQQVECFSSYRLWLYGYGYCYGYGSHSYIHDCNSVKRRVSGQIVKKRKSHLFSCAGPTPFGSFSRCSLAGTFIYEIAPTFVLPVFSPLGSSLLKQNLFNVLLMEKDKRSILALKFCVVFYYN